MARVNRLFEFLEQAGRTPFVYGDHDCLLYPSNWCRAVTGIDPAADFRGRYHTHIGALRILNREGGLLALAERQMTAAGLADVAPDAVVAGDVAVVRAPRPDGRLAHVGAVFTGRLWSALGVTGLVAGPFIPDKAWRPLCPR